MAMNQIRQHQEPFQLFFVKCFFKKRISVKKKIALFFMISALITGTLFCKEVKNSEEEKDEYGLAFTLKNGYFYPQENVLREIFARSGGKGGYWIEGAIHYNFWKGLNVEASGSYFKHKGLALCGCESVEVKIPTFGLGLKYFWKAHERIELFAGAGLRTFFYHEKNGSSYVIQCVDKIRVGGMVNAGIEFNVYKGLFVNLFVDYNIGKLNSKCNNSCNACNTCCSTTQCGSCVPSCCYSIHIGGVVGGIGLGYKF